MVKASSLESLYPNVVGEDKVPELIMTFRQSSGKQRHCAVRVSPRILGIRWLEKLPIFEHTRLPLRNEIEE